MPCDTRVGHISRLQSCCRSDLPTGSLALGDVADQGHGAVELHAHPPASLHSARGFPGFGRGGREGPRLALAR